MRLMHNMYNNGSKLFGLSQGQIRGNDFVHNGGWYNNKGEKIGWGDLSPNDIVNIAFGLEGDEQFYILPESSSYWNFTKVNSDLSHNVNKDESAPGVEYVKAKARYLIEAGKVTVFLEQYFMAEKRDHADLYQKKFGPTVKVIISYHQNIEV